MRQSVSGAVPGVGDSEGSLQHGSAAAVHVELTPGKPTEIRGVRCVEKKQGGLPFRRGELQAHAARAVLQAEVETGLLHDVTDEIGIQLKQQQLVVPRLDYLHLYHFSSPWFGDVRRAYIGWMPPVRALVLFDIDGTLVRKAGPHHRLALEAAVQQVTGITASTENVPVAGMLDRDIVLQMMRQAGAKPAAVRKAMPEIVEVAQALYADTCPNLERKVLPGVRAVLNGLGRRGIPMGLVTGNLTRIGWKKVEQAGLRRHFLFGAFAELARDRAGLVRIAIREARKMGLTDRNSRVSLIGDHINDIRAARANGIQSIAVATGVLATEQLAPHGPDLLLSDLRALDLEMLL